MLSVERVGDKVRKDLSKYGDASDQYSYFFDDLFDSAEAKKMLVTEGVDERLQADICESYLASHKLFREDDKKFSSTSEERQATWFSHLCAGAVNLGYSRESQDKKISDYAKVIRVRLTGKTRTPDLLAIMDAMGDNRIHERLS